LNTARTIRATKTLSIDPAVKVCTKCGGLGPFGKNKSRKDGLQCWCKQCLRAYGAANAVRIRARANAWAKNNLARIRARRKAWTAEERAADNARHIAWRLLHPEAHKASQQKYNKSNAEKRAVLTQRRRAALRGVPSTLTQQEWLEILEYFNWTCAYCLRTGLKRTMEHVIPVSRGGGTTAENIVPACGKCNSKKRNRWVLCMLSASSLRGCGIRTMER
jgi:hypothetical protein